jgi:transmembrane sensor
VFQVGLDADTVDVALLQGEVAIATHAHGQARSASLKAGQQLRYDRDGEIGPVQPVDALAAEGWTHGKLFVHDWSLPQLLAAMNRYSDTKLEVGDSALDNVRISGAFKAGDQQTLLQILDQGWSIDARRASPNRIVLSQRTTGTAPPHPSSR